MPTRNSAAVTIVVVLLAAAILAGLGLAQEPTGTVFRADTRLVPLYISVLDHRGNLLTDLTRDDFTVFENSVEQEIRSFGREDVPVSMGLIIDNSGSMRDKRAAVESAALVLVERSNPNDEVFIVNFNDEAYLDVDFTNDVDKMEEGLTRIDSRGGTAMRDAISMSMDHLVENASRDKKVLLVVTDGNDNTSGTTLEELVRKAQQSEVLIYAIGLLNQEQRRERQRAQRALDALTEASGGFAYYPDEVTEVEQLCVQVAHEIRNQYVITYSPANQELDGSFRRIQVRVAGRGRAQVRTRTGYYATPYEPETTDSSLTKSSLK